MAETRFHSRFRSPGNEYTGVSAGEVFNDPDDVLNDPGGAFNDPGAFLMILVACLRILVRFL